MIENKKGQVITFYSYKGGTGRTMALANVATLLSEKSKVLMIDWDLEAPGLHYFFASKGIKDATEKPGLINLFREIQKLLEQHPEWNSDQFEAELFSSLDLSEYIYIIIEEKMSLLAAGKINRDYPHEVATFQWETLFYRAPWLFRTFANYLATQFDYILIDSRTGLNDISGICTALMPEKLVSIFTPSRQSIEGIIKSIVNALHYRKESDDLRLLNIFPVPSRIELQEKLLFDDWRFDSVDGSIKGYQPLFEELFKNSYNLDDCDLTYYFDNIQIQQFPYYAYGEKIAVAETQGTGRFSLSESYSLLTEAISKSITSWTFQDSKIKLSSESQEFGVPKRKPQMEAVYLRLISHRLSSIWQGLERIRQWVSEDLENQDAYGLLLDAVEENPDLREQARDLLIEAMQHGSKSAQKALAILPSTAQDLLVDADDAYYATEYERAIQIYRQVLKLDPDNIRAKEYLTKAIEYQKGGIITSNLPRDAVQYYRQARSYIAARDYLTAMKMLGAAIESAREWGR